MSLRPRSEKDIYSIDLHERIIVSDFLVTKIHNGWLYEKSIRTTNGNSISITFVPYTDNNVNVFHTKTIKEK